MQSRRRASDARFRFFLGALNCSLPKMLMSNFKINVFILYVNNYQVDKVVFFAAMSKIPTAEREI